MQDSDCKIIEVTSVEEAIEFIKGRRPIKNLMRDKFGLILLDLSLPDVSGIEILKTMRSLKEEHKIPIIVLTAHEESHLIIDAMKLGAIDYLIKGKYGDNLTKLFDDIKDIVLKRN